MEVGGANRRLGAEPARPRPNGAKHLPSAWRSDGRELNKGSTRRRFRDTYWHSHDGTHKNVSRKTPDTWRAPHWARPSATAAAPQEYLGSPLWSKANEIDGPTNKVSLPLNIATHDPDPPCRCSCCLRVMSRSSRAKFHFCTNDSDTNAAPSAWLERCVHVCVRVPQGGGLCHKGEGRRNE